MPPHSQEPLQIEETQGTHGDQRILRLQGPVVLATLFPFQNTLRAKACRSLIIDFTAVPYVDSAGIGALVGAHVSQSKNGCSLALVGVNERVRNALKVTRVEQFFRFFPNVPDAQAASA